MALGHRTSPDALFSKRNRARGSQTRVQCLGRREVSDPERKVYVLPMKAGVNTLLLRFTASQLARDDHANRLMPATEFQCRQCPLDASPLI